MKQEARRLRVSNWDHYQHYKDRRPPWIKLHVALLDDYEFTRLDANCRLLAISMMLLAAKTENHIPSDPDWISRALHWNKPPNVIVLVNAGFLTLCDCNRCVASTGASAPLAERKQVASPDVQETETETETDRGSSSPFARSDADIAPERVFLVVAKQKGGQARWVLPEGKAEEWATTYPGVDVPSELRAARQWLIDNPSRRKTSRGMLRFLNSWLERRQNRGGLFAKQRAEQLAGEEARKKDEARARVNDDPHSPSRHGIKHVDGRRWCSRAGAWVTADEWRPLEHGRA